MNWIQSILYGIVSGIASFLPVSSYGHQVFMRQLFGMTAPDHLTDLLVHVALLVAVYMGCRKNLKTFGWELGANKRRRRLGRGQIERHRIYDVRLLTTASISTLLVLLLCNGGRKTEQLPLLVCLFFIINGIILYITDHMRQSNKDASYMTGLDAVLMGVFSGLRVFPGISGVGGAMSMAIGRGADRTHGLNWALILCIPAFALLAIFDVVAAATAVDFVISWAAIGCGILAAFGAFAGGIATIMLMRFLIVNTGFTGFACYSWGMAILTFILYLIA